MSNAAEVVVTGMGAITCAGVGVEAFRSAALAGRTGISRITEFPTEKLPVQIAGMVRDFDPATVLDAKQVRLAARVVQLAMGAAHEATGGVTEGGLGDVHRIGTIVGTSTGGMEVLAEQMEVCAVKGPRRVSPFAVPQLMDNAAAAWMALKWGLRGPAYSIATACSTSMDAMGLAFDLIHSGRLDAALVGGAEGAVIPFTLGSFGAAGLLSRRNDSPETASRPFDKERDGFVLAEGASMFVLERRDRAEQRGAKILARLCGYGATQDAHHVVTPLKDGSRMAEAMTMAMGQAGIAPADVGYISAHGLGTRWSDLAESSAIHQAFGAHADQVRVGATKSMVGYALGAAGGINAMAAVLAVNEGLMSPCVTYKTPDPECRLNIVAGEAVRQKVGYAISNSAGFGGHNSCLVFGAP